MVVDYRRKAAAKRPRTTAIEEDGRPVAELGYPVDPDVELPLPFARAWKAANVLVLDSSVLTAKTIPALQWLDCLQNAQIGFVSLTLTV
jgi:hypothetical protein